MRILLFTLLFSCTHYETQKSVKSEMANYNFKSYSQIKKYVSTIVSSHNEYSSSQKREIINAVSKGLDLKKAIRLKESKTLQMTMDSLLSKNVDLKKVGALKKEMRKIYDRKYEVFLETANDLKSILGVNSKIPKIIQELEPAIRF